MFGVENVGEGSDQNGDLDGGDRSVLALLDGTDVTSRVKSVRLALADEGAPFDAFFS